MTIRCNRIKIPKQQIVEINVGDELQTEWPAGDAVAINVNVCSNAATIDILDLKQNIIALFWISQTISFYYAHHHCCRSSELNLNLSSNSLR